MSAGIKTEGSVAADRARIVVAFGGHIDAVRPLRFSLRNIIRGLQRPNLRLLGNQLITSKLIEQPRQLVALRS